MRDVSIHVNGRTAWAEFYWHFVGQSWPVFALLLFTATGAVCGHVLPAGLLLVRRNNLEKFERHEWIREVKNGVVEFLGEPLPEGTLVKIRTK